MHKNNTMLSNGIAFVIVAIAFVVSWKMIIPNYQSNQKQNAQLDLDIQNAKAKLSSLSTTKASLASLGDTFNKMLVAVPADKGVPNLISELEAIAKSNSLSIPSIQIGDSNTAAASTTDGSATVSNNKVNVSFAVEGSYDNLSKMITALESDIRFMNIDSIAFSKVQTESGSSSDKMTLSVQLKAYKFIDDSLVSAVNASLLSGSN